MFDIRLCKRIPFIGMLLALSVFTGIACDAGTDTVTRAATMTATATSTATMTATATSTATTAATDTMTDPCPPPDRGFRPYTGRWSVEEEILWNDVIAVVNLVSADRGVDARGIGNEIEYHKTLEFTFQVKEYLKGSGGDQVVGMVFGLDCSFDTRLEAVNHPGKDVDPDRNTHWDDREAVVFLRGDDIVNWDAGRYELGIESSDSFSGGEAYSIANRHFRPWLPAVSPETDEQRFLLETDLGPWSPETITLDELKARIAALQKELEEGQTDEYKQCILSKYRAERINRYREEVLGLSSRSPWVPCRERFS